MKIVDSNCSRLNRSVSFEYMPSQQIKVFHQNTNDFKLLSLILLHFFINMSEINKTNRCPRNLSRNNLQFSLLKISNQEKILSNSSEKLHFTHSFYVGSSANKQIHLKECNHEEER